GEMVSLMVHLGDRLDLYRALDRAGPVTAADLAERTGLHERWLLEWLRGQAAARLVDSTDGERFELTPAGSAVLADDDTSLAFAAGAFAGPLPPDVVEGLAEAFRTGIGLPYDRMGPSGAHRTERMLGPWARLALVPTILPALDGVVVKLEAGARVLDVGCGAGVALLAMAGSYPRSEFHGVDLSKHAVDRARAKVADAGLANLTVVEGRAEDLADAGADSGDAGFDLVLTFDCLHDMTRPAEAVAAIRRVVAPDGTWLVKDIRSAPEWAANQANPMLAMLYGFSVASCMSSALSEPGGAGLGTLGFNPDVAEAMVRKAGFTRFAMHDFDDPANLYYEVRP
nr:methyltransferase domain-containing protein [Acidimicrobiia bacterium]